MVNVFDLILGISSSQKIKLFEETNEENEHGGITFDDILVFEGKAMEVPIQAFDSYVGDYPSMIRLEIHDEVLEIYYE